MYMDRQAESYVTDTYTGTGVVIQNRMRQLLFFGLLSIALLVALPASADRDISKKDFSGWLKDYDSLVFVEERNAFIFFNEEKRGLYEDIILDSLVVYSQQAEEDATVANSASEYLTQGVNDLLKEKGLAADGPGEKTVKLKLAITGVEKSKEDLKAINFIPVAAVFRAAKTATGNTATYIDAMFEAEMVDSMTGERLAAIVVKGISETEKKSGDELTFEDVQETLDAWLARFSKTLDDYLAKPKPKR